MSKEEPKFYSYFASFLILILTIILFLSSRLGIPYLETLKPSWLILFFVIGMLAVVGFVYSTQGTRLGESKIGRFVRSVDMVLGDFPYSFVAFIFSLFVATGFTLETSEPEAVSLGMEGPGQALAFDPIFLLLFLALGVILIFHWLR